MWESKSIIDGTTAINDRVAAKVIGVSGQSRLRSVHKALCCAVGFVWHYSNRQLVHCWASDVRLRKSLKLQPCVACIVHD